MISCLTSRFALDVLATALMGMFPGRITQKLLNSRQMQFVVELENTLKSPPPPSFWLFSQFPAHYCDSLWMRVLLSQGLFNSF
jgi:hypothetical protein